MAEQRARNARALPQNDGRRRGLRAWCTPFVGWAKTPALNLEVGDAAARRAHQNKMRWARFVPSLTRRRQSFAHPTAPHDRNTLYLKCRLISSSTTAIARIKVLAFQNSSGLRSISGVNVGLTKLLAGRRRLWTNSDS